MKRTKMIKKHRIRNVAEVMYSVLLGVGVLFLVFVFMGGTFGDEFIITKEVCHNESIEYSFPNEFKEIECPRFILKAMEEPCYDFNHNKIINATCIGEFTCWKTADRKNNVILVEEYSTLQKGLWGSEFTLFSEAYFLGNQTEIAYGQGYGQSTYEKEICSQEEFIDLDTVYGIELRDNLWFYPHRNDAEKWLNENGVCVLEIKKGACVNPSNHPTDWNYLESICEENWDKDRGCFKWKIGDYTITRK